MVEGNKIYPFTNDVIFKVVMQDESIAKGLISIILGRKVSKIKNYTTQKDKKFQKLTRGVRFAYILKIANPLTKWKCKTPLA